eukprot:3904535-Prymnesium_polylepis.1
MTPDECVSIHLETPIESCTAARVVAKGSLGWEAQECAALTPRFCPRRVGVQLAGVAAPGASVAV